MAKNALPMPTGGGVLSKVSGILITLAVLAMVVQHPADSAQWVSQAVTTVGTVVDGLATFLREVTG